MPLPVTDAPQGSQVWSRCYQKCLRLSDTNWLITPALITRSRRAKTKLPHWKSCGLGQTSCGGKPRSFVTGPFSLWQRSRFAVADTVDASFGVGCFASLECISTLTL